MQPQTEKPVKMARIIPLHKLPVFSIVDPPDSTFSFEDGAAFLINKPIGWSSYEVVKHLRKRLDMSKIGHTGTLDPAACGLLILCCGRGTRTVSQIQELSKTYWAEITFGASTYSFDAETEVKNKADFEHVTRNAIENVLNEYFTGEVSQIPPMYSALKHNGTPLYKLARQKKSVERKARQITIYSSRIVCFNLPKVELTIRCSKGTYIRSIANSLGEKLNSAAHLSALERTAIGHFKNKNALTIEDLDLIFGSSEV